jgi:hypothetical protein
MTIGKNILFKCQTYLLFISIDKLKKAILEIFLF